MRIHLERLRPLAGRLVLVSNSALSDAARSRAGETCDRVIERANIGWDFAAWRDALADEDMGIWDEVVLTNSSVVGPLFPLAPIFREMAQRGPDFWGMVQSRHMARHLQSYFLCFSGAVARSETWGRFWSEVADLADKRTVIRRYETGMTGTLARAGFTWDSYMQSPRFPRSIRMVHVERLKTIRIPMDVNFVNKTVELHEDLLRRGMPYLKGSLLWGKDCYRCAPLARLKAIDGVHYPWAELVA